MEVLLLPLRRGIGFSRGCSIGSAPPSSIPSTNPAKPIPQMNRKILTAPLLLALSASGASAFSPAEEFIATSRVSADCSIDSAIRGAQGPVFMVVASTDPTFQHGVFKLGMGTLDASGNGQHTALIRDPEVLPPNFVIHVRAAYLARRGMRWTETKTLVLNAIPSERIDFTWAPDCLSISTGESLENQWNPVGVRVFADTHHPTLPSLAIALDSANPSPEMDLLTPGAGPGNVDAWEKLLVVAGNHGGFDSSNNVMVPVAEDLGGVVVFDFAQPTYLDRITLVDVDAPGGFMRCYDGATLIDEIALPMTGDNGVQTIGFPLQKVTRLKVNFKCAAGIAELSYLPCAERVNFDHTLTGIPLGLREGEIVDDELRADYGLRVKADSHHPTNQGRAILIRADGQVLPNDAEQMVLAVAAHPDDANQDGAVEIATPEPLGGVLVLDFDFDVTWRSARVADIDGSDTGFFKAEDAAGNLLGTFPLTAGPDGAIQEIAPGLSGVRRIKLNVHGTGALVSLDYCADAQPH